MWIDLIPKVGGRFMRRAQYLRNAKLEAQAWLTRIAQREAELFSDIENSGRFTKEELSKAFKEMPADTVRYLPEWPKKV